MISTLLQFDCRPRQRRATGLDSASVSQAGQRVARPLELPGFTLTSKLSSCVGVLVRAQNVRVVLRPHETFGKVCLIALRELSGKIEAGTLWIPRAALGAFLKRRRIA